jgi:hypothetical protein
MRAKIGPGTFFAGLALIDQQDVGDLLAQQVEGDRQAALAGPDHQDVQHRLALMGPGWHPGAGGIIGQRKVAHDLGFQVAKAVHGEYSERGQCWKPVCRRWARHSGRTGLPAIDT